MTVHRPASGDDDLYATLGVPTGATDEDITRAYRRQARQHHPDANPEAGGDAFAELTDAYDILHDPDRRRSYDGTRRARTQAAEAAAGVRIPIRHITSPPQDRSFGGAGTTSATMPRPATNGGPAGRDPAPRPPRPRTRSGDATPTPTWPSSRTGGDLIGSHPIGGHQQRPGLDDLAVRQRRTPRHRLQRPLLNRNEQRALQP
jgi:curved DNA-binding protein CbpA